MISKEFQSYKRFIHPDLLVTNYESYFFFLFNNNNELLMIFKIRMKIKIN